MGCAAGIVLFVLLAVFCPASAKVILIARNRTLAFDDVEASFAPPVNASGERGVLCLAEPLDACSDLTNEFSGTSNDSSAFVLIIRGGCSFESKVKRAQKAGFKAAIVYDNEDTGVLISMVGDPSDIKIHAVFISRASGETLKKYSKASRKTLKNLGVLPDMEFWLTPSLENTAWSIMAISFISLLAIAGVLALCFYVRRHRVRPRRRQTFRVREFYGMSAQLVESMPSLIFTAVLEDNCTSSLCAICLEDYSVGDKLRILPCHHKFHAVCVDSWLTAWRTFCPVCKRDARSSAGHPPASESTPLLSSGLASESSSELSSGRPLLRSSSDVQTFPPSQSARNPLSHSHATTSYLLQSQRSTHHSSPIPISQSSVDLRNSRSARRCMSQTVSPFSSFPHSQQSQRLYLQSPPIPIVRSSADLRNPQGLCQSHSSSPNSPSCSSVSPLNPRYTT